MNALEFEAINDEGIASGMPFSGRRDYVLYDSKTAKIRQYKITTPGEQYLHSTSGIDAQNDVTMEIVFHHQTGGMGLGNKRSLVLLQNSPTEPAISAYVGESGLVAGTILLENGSAEGYTYQSGTYATFSVPGSASTYVSAISRDGVIAGSFKDSAGHFHGYTKNGDAYTTLVSPDGATLYPIGVANSGEVVGEADLKKTSYAFIYVNAKVYPFSASKTFGTSLRGINELGSIYGWLSSPNGNGSSFIAQCPGNKADPCVK